MTGYSSGIITTSTAAIHGIIRYYLCYIWKQHVEKPIRTNGIIPLSLFDVMAGVHTIDAYSYTLDISHPNGTHPAATQTTQSRRHAKQDPKTPNRYTSSSMLSQTPPVPSNLSRPYQLLDGEESVTGRLASTANVQPLSAPWLLERLVFM